MLSAHRPSGFTGVAVAAAGVVACTALVEALDELTPASSLGVLYILPVLLVSTYWGLAAGIGTSLGSALAFNLFFLPPTGRVTIADNRNVAALITFVVVAFVTSRFADVARARAIEAVARREEADAAAEVARGLLAAAQERDALQLQVAESDARDAVKTAVLRAVSHDLRSPLTSILTAGSALGSARISDEDRAALSAGVVEEAQRLSHLIDDLLDMSKLETGAAEPRADWCALDELLHTAGQLAGGEVTYVIDGDLPLLKADAAQLERAFENLIANARRHSGGGPVSVRARRVGERVLVRVVDQGPGIPQAEQERIFEPFWRGDNDASFTAPGSGLGLAIVRGFVEANGGRVWVESLLGQGASFVVEFGVTAQ